MPQRLFGEGGQDPDAFVALFLGDDSRSKSTQIQHVIAMPKI